MDILERYRKLIYIALALASVAGLYAFYARQPRPDDVVIAIPTETPAPSLMVTPEIERRLYVHVVGEVLRPGVYDLREDARVVDAVQAAGGLTDSADAEMINLADRIGDGQQVRVPALGTTPSPTLTPYPVSGNQRLGTTLDLSGGLMNINVASAAELESLPGIGPVLSQRIVDYRTQHGAFTSIDEIMEVSGIGNAIYAQITGLITVQ